tara:strand:- start:12 stop:344 length:333 start_codon:yes stop_codon:yes gene_type:complete
MLQIVSKKLATKPWRNTVFVDDDGEVYLPAGDFGDEVAMVWCLLRVGKRFLINEGHLYTPAFWLVQEYPHMASKINDVTQCFRQYKLTSDGSQYVDVNSRPGPTVFESAR